MKYGKFIDLIGTALLFIGFLLAFLPHTAHVAIGFDETSHIKHIISGVIVLVIGLGILVYNNKALKFMPKKAFR